MSARWRRSKRNLRFDIFKALSKVKGKGFARITKVKDTRSKKQAYPFRRVPKLHLEEKLKEPKPLIDVLNEKNETVVIAELVGFNREDLKINVRDQRLILSAHASDRKYYKSLNLPERVIPSTMRTTYKNGVLEIHLKKAVEEKAIDKVAG
jgi:HSP20 family molecular chaperone IbpA